MGKFSHLQRVFGDNPRKSVKLYQTCCQPRRYLLLLESNDPQSEFESKPLKDPSRV